MTKTMYVNSGGTAVCTGTAKQDVPTLSTTPSTNTTWTASHTKSQAAESFRITFPSSEPNSADWPAASGGDPYGFSYYISAAGANMTFGVAATDGFGRRNSSCVQQESAAGPGATHSGTGWFTDTHTSWNPSAGTATDRFVVRLWGVNGNTKATEAVTLDSYNGTTYSRLYGPWPPAGVEVTPGAATCVAAVVAPTVQLGSTSYTPSPSVAVSAVVAPTVQLGSINYTPGPSVAISAVVDPTVQYGSLNITPSPSVAVSAVIDPTVQLGSLNITPTAISAIAEKVDPSIQITEGSAEVTPDPVTCVAAVVDPTVQLGSLNLSPGPVTCVGACVDPTVVLGSISITPAPATCVGTVVDPTVELGSISYTPSVAVAIASVLDPTVIQSSTSVVPAPSTAIAEKVDPQVQISGEAETPSRIVTTFLLLRRHIQRMRGHR